jgi:hypothetical protein
MTFLFRNYIPILEIFLDGNVTVSAMLLNVKRVDVAVVDSESLVHHETKPHLGIGAIETLKLNESHDFSN